MPRTFASLTEDNRAELYARIVEQVSREDTLIDQRLTYTLTFQSILFAALAFAARGAPDDEIRIVLTQIVPIFGIGTSFFGFMGVVAGFISIWQKLEAWRYYFKNNQEDNQNDEYTSPTGRGIVLFVAWSGYIAFASGLVLGWLFIYLRLN